jgi:hypothetical protein
MHKTNNGTATEPSHARHLAGVSRPMVDLSLSRKINQQDQYHHPWLAYRLYSTGR